MKALAEEVSKDIGPSLAAVLDATLTAIATKTPMAPKIEARALGGKKSAKQQKVVDLAKEAEHAEKKK